MGEVGLNEAVLGLCLRTEMFPKGAGVLAAVSGGPDSVAMLRALVLLRDRLGIGEIGVAHVHHGLRGENADRDAAFVAHLAKGMALPFFLEKISANDLAASNGLCLEEAGRAARYDFFNRICDKNGYDLVAVAHTADDNAETVLMFLLRGAAGGGLSGISPIRGKIVRPLLSATRRQVLDFIRDEGLSFVTDETNSDPAFLRNRIRNELLPFLADGYNPAISEALNRLACVAEAEESFWEKFVSTRLKNLSVSGEEGQICIAAKGLLAEHRAVQRRLVRAAVEKVKGDLKRIGLVHVDDVLSLKSGKTAHLPDGIVVRRVRGVFSFSRPYDFCARPGKK